MDDTWAVQRLDLENFKSYRDRETVGPFEHNFVAVIGPNGSGELFA